MIFKTSVASLTIWRKFQFDWWTVRIWPSCHWWVKQIGNLKVICDFPARKFHLVSWIWILLVVVKQSYMIKCKMSIFHFCDLHSPTKIPQSWPIWTKNTPMKSIWPLDFISSDHNLFQWSEKMFQFLQLLSSPDTLSLSQFSVYKRHRAIRAFSY